MRQRPRRTDPSSTGVVLSRSFSQDSDALIVGVQDLSVQWIFERTVSEADQNPNESEPQASDVAVYAANVGSVIVVADGALSVNLWAKNEWGWSLVSQLTLDPHTESAPIATRFRQVFVQVTSVGQNPVTIRVGALV